MSPLTRRLGAGILIALLAAGAGFLTARQVRAPDAVANQSIDDISLPDLDGRWQTLNQWRGKTILLNFWATWCPPCREEIPLFVEYQKTYGERGLQVVGVAIDNQEAVRKFSKEMGVNFPQLLAYDSGLDLMSRFGNRAGGLPFSVVISPSGAVISRKTGAYHRGDMDALVSQIRP